MTDSDQKTIISLFAHPDDELGAIGTLANHVEKGDRVILAWTTYGELTTFFPDLDQEEVKQERERHAKQITSLIGAEKYIFLDLGDSYVQNTRIQRVKIAKFYVNERPDVVITWGLNNNHPDHRFTGYLALDAIKLARINRVVETDSPHRKNVKLLHYFEKDSALPVKYVDIPEESMKIAKKCANFYAEIYDWKKVEEWVVDRRRARGIESNTKFAEKFNVRFEFDKPSRYVI